MTESGLFSVQTFLAILTSFLSTAPTPPPDDYGHPSARPAAVEHFARAETLLQDSPQFWTAPFVIADLEKREVWVWGQSTRTLPGDPIEFFVIAENSGQDYEALMKAFAKPSDLHTALTKIGLQPGQSFQPEAHNYWPRGDRVTAELQWKPQEEEAPVTTPVEALLLEDNQPMRPEPWVFTGSPHVPAPNQPGHDPVYAADVFGPNSIASTFNLTHTVFDLSRQGTKTLTYGTFRRAASHKAPEGTPMLLRLRPADPDTYPAPREWQATLSGPLPTVTVTGKHAPAATTLEELGSAIHARENEECFLQVQFSPDMRLRDILPAAQKLQLMAQTLDRLHISPPAKGRMFYMAFIPDPVYRNRQRRPSQPLELHLHPTGATLMELTETWGESRIPDIHETRKHLETPEAWIRYLERQDSRVNVLFVYASPDTPHRQILNWVLPVLHRFPVVYVYTSPSPEP